MVRSPIIVGLKNVPHNSPMVVVTNHSRLLDEILIGIPDSVGGNRLKKGL